MRAGAAADGLSTACEARSVVAGFEIGRNIFNRPTSREDNRPAGQPHLLANIYMVAASRCFGQHGLIGSTPKLRWFRTPMIPGTGLAVRLN